METIRKKLSTDMDLSMCSLDVAIRQFYKEFKIYPKWFNVNISIEGIFAGIQIYFYRCLDKINPFGGDKKDIYFSVNRDLKADVWELWSFENDKMYVIYSEGA